jgi:hypothetical protein
MNDIVAGLIHHSHDYEKVKHERKERKERNV